MKLSLVATQGKSAGKAIPITGPEFVVGRDPQCHLRPASPLISKRHCAIVVRGEKAFVLDFGSTNGTFVNDQPVKGEAELHDADRLKIGPLELQVRVEVTKLVTKAAKPAPAPKPAASTGNEDEDSVAAMLLTGGDESPGTQAEKGTAEEPIPTDTTIMEIPAMPSTEARSLTPEEKAAADKKEAEKKSAEKKERMGSTSDAARKLLEKFARRSRG